jgi:MoaA/NifB/PqqE/SkfB family radical SAM enzyme
MSFPRRVSLTITDACNLKCKMCGQWSESGYIRNSRPGRAGMRLNDWKSVVDEVYVDSA